MYDVRLQPEVEPEFPNRCHACGASNPEAERMLATARSFPLVHTLVPLPIPLGRGRFRAVPYCSPCRARDRRLVLMQNVLGFPWFFVMMMVSILIAKQVTNSGAWILIAMILTLALNAPLWVWVIWKSPAVEVSADRDGVVWTFRSRWAAGRFARMNGAAVKGPLSGLD